MTNFILKYLHFSHIYPGKKYAHFALQSKICVCSEMKLPNFKFFFQIFKQDHSALTYVLNLVRGQKLMEIDMLFLTMTIFGLFLTIFQKKTKFCKKNRQKNHCRQLLGQQPLRQIESTKGKVFREKNFLEVGQLHRI